MVFRYTVLLFLFISIASHDCGFAQTFYFDGWHEIDVSNDQNDKLTEIKRLRDDELEPLQRICSDSDSKLQKATHRLRHVIFERGNELEQILTAEQLESLNEKRLERTRGHAKANAEFMRKFASFLDAVASAESMSVYEGLPRATDDELAKIKQANKTIELGGWSFYAAPLNASQSTVEKLRSTFVDYREFKLYFADVFGAGRVGKGCGGFHPDFCVQWTIKNKSYLALVCLGCHELEFISPSVKTKFDFDIGAWQSFAQVAISTFRFRADDINYK